LIIFSNMRQFTIQIISNFTKNLINFSDFRQIILYKLSDFGDN
jgi:hypothetical protein